MAKNRLKELRKEKGLWQKDIADLLNIQQSTYSYWESGTYDADLGSLKKLADFYGVTIGYLLGHENYSVAPSIQIPENITAISLAFHNIKNLTQAEIDDAETYILFKRKQKEDKG